MSRKMTRHTIMALEAGKYFPSLPCCWHSASRALSASEWIRCSSTWRLAIRVFPHRDDAALDAENGVPGEAGAGGEDDGKGESRGQKLRHRTRLGRHVRRTQLPSGGGGFGRRHYPGTDEVLSEGGGGQRQEQDARSHTLLYAARRAGLSRSCGRGVRHESGSDGVSLFLYPLPERI